MTEHQMSLIEEILTEQLRGVDFKLSYTPILEEIAFETEDMRFKTSPYNTLFEIVDHLIAQYKNWKERWSKIESVITYLQNRLTQEVKGDVIIQHQYKHNYIVTFNFNAGFSVEVPLTFLYKFIDEEDYTYRLMNVVIDNLMEKVTRLILK